ncbi:hypothetical protein ACSSS7_004196 [Eimeria intestinalis]
MCGAVPDCCATASCGTPQRRSGSRAHVSARAAAAAGHLSAARASKIRAKSRIDPLSTPCRVALFLQEPPCFFAFLMRQLLAQRFSCSQQQLCSVSDGCAARVVGKADEAETQN